MAARIPAYWTFIRYPALTRLGPTMYFLLTMHPEKEKRLHERIPFPDVKGSVEISETVKHITVINASAEGVCISGIHIPVGSVIRLSINDPNDIGDISLYCKVVWATGQKAREKLSGLSFLNTNRVLFKKDLISFNRLLEVVQAELNPS